MNEKKEKYENFITVSDRFVEIYKMFNVTNQVDIISPLTEDEALHIRRDIGISNIIS